MSPLSLIIWGYESWCGSVASIEKCDFFHYKVMKRILKMPMSREKDETIRRIMIREMFSNEEKIKDACRRRQLFFAGRASRMKNNTLPKASLTSTTVV